MKSVVPKINASRRWIAAVGIISCVLIVCTVVFEVYESALSPRSHWIIGFFDLRRENNFAVWFSGILFLVTAVHYFDGGMNKNRWSPRVRRSWLLLALILGLFSFDEVSSVHERIELIEHGVLFGLVPAALFTIGLLVYSLLGLRNDPDSKRAIGWLVLAFAILATVPLQELIGHRFADSAASVAAYGGIEEASELLASVILLAVAVFFSYGPFEPGSHYEGPFLEMPMVARSYVLAFSIAAIPLFAYASAAVTDQYRGHPADWYVSSIFCFATLHVVRSSLTRPGRIGIPVAGGIGLCISSLAVVFTPTEALVSTSSISRRATVLMLGVILASSLWLRIKRSDGISAIAIVSAAVIFMVLYELGSENAFLGYLLIQILAVTTYSLVTSDRK